jgi:hypothetical protein
VWRRDEVLQGCDLKEVQRWGRAARKAFIGDLAWIRAGNRIVQPTTA